MELLSCYCYYYYRLLLLVLSIMPIDSRTWYVRIGVFQSTKIVTQSNSFQKDNLNFTVQNIAFLYNKMSIKFFLILALLMWVLLKINFDISWSVIAKCIEGPLVSIHSACENAFTKQLIELLLIVCGDVVLRTDHPSNIKRGGVCIYYKDHLLS